VLVLIAQTAFGIGWSAYLILPKYLTTVLGASPQTIGHIAAISGFSAVSTILLVLALIDRVPKAWLLQAGSLVVVLVSLGYLRVHELGPAVYLLQSGVGAAFVLAYNASVTLVTERAPEARLGQTIGWLGAANMTTNAVGSAAAEQVAAAFGWHTVFYGCALVGLVAFLIGFFVKGGPRVSAVSPGTPAAPVPPDTAPVSSRTPSPSPAALRLRPLALALGCSLIAGITFTAMFTFIQPYALGLGAKDVASFFIGFTSAAVFVRLGFGSLGDRHGRRPVAAGALVLYGSAALAASRLSVSFLPFYGAAFGLAHGVFYPTLNAYALECAPASYRGRVVTVFNGLFNTGSAFGSLAWGSLAQAAGYPPVFVVAGALPFLGVVLHSRSAGAGRSKTR
jgi:MFS family permease